MLRRIGNGRLKLLIRRLGIIFLAGVSPIVVVSCGDVSKKNEVDGVAKDGKRTDSDETNVKEEVANTTTKEQESSYSDLLLLTSELEAKEISLKRLLDLKQRQSSTLTTLQGELESLPATLPGLYDLVERYEDASKLLYNLRLDLIREKNAKSDLYTELPLYILTFKWVWGIFTGYRPTHFLAQKELQLKAAEEQIGSQLATLKENVKEKVASTISTFKTFEGKLDKLLMDSKDGFERFFLVISSLRGKIKAIRERLEGSFRVRMDLDLVFPELFQADPTKKLVYVDGKGKDSSSSKQTKSSDKLISRTDWLLREKGEWLNVFPSLLAEIATTYDELNSAVAAGSKRGTNIITDLLLDRKEEIRSLEQNLISTRAEKEVNLKKLNDILDRFKDISKNLNSSDDLKKTLASLKADVDAAKADLNMSVDRVKIVAILSKDIEDIFDELVVARAVTTDAINLERERLLSVYLPALRLAERERIVKERADTLREFMLYTLGFKWLWGVFTGYSPTVNFSDKLSEYKLAVDNLMHFEAKKPSFNARMHDLKDKFKTAGDKIKRLLAKAEISAKKLSFTKAFDNFKLRVSGFIKTLTDRLGNSEAISVDYRSLISDYLTSSKADIRTDLTTIEGDNKKGGLISIDLKKPSGMSNFNTQVSDIDYLGLTKELDELIRQEIGKRDDNVEFVKVKSEELKRLEGYIDSSISPVRSLSITKSERELDSKDEKEKKEELSGMFKFNDLQSLLSFANTVKKGLLVTFYSLSYCPYCMRVKKQFEYLVKKYHFVVAFIDFDTAPEDTYEQVTSIEGPVFNGAVPYLKLYLNGALFRVVKGFKPLPTLASYLGFDEREDLDYSDLPEPSH